jgi:hypothetical protein
VNLPEYFGKQPDPITRDELIEASTRDIGNRRAFVSLRLPDLMQLTSLTIGVNANGVSVVSMDAQHFHRLVALLILGGYLDNLDFGRLVSAITD